MRLFRRREMEMLRSQLQQLTEENQRLSADLAALRQALPERQSAAPENEERGRGRPGGLVRAQRAMRRADGTFMSAAEVDEAIRADYERHARGGRARAAGAPREGTGRFVSNL